MRVLVVLLLAAGGTATAGQLLVNGGFETGDLTGWLVFDQPGSAGTFVVSTGMTAPFSGVPTVGPAGGIYYAVFDQDGPSAAVLIQPFAVLPGLPATLSFDLFVNDWHGAVAIVNPAGLDYTAVPNQHARVDLLSGGATPFDTDAGVLANFYLGIDGYGVYPYTHYVFDISSYVAGGGSFQIRFGAVDTEYYLNAGVDNVSIEARVIPEPAPIALLGLGLAGLVVCAIRRRRS